VRGGRSIDAVWTYETPYAVAADTTTSLSQPDRTDAIEIRWWTNRAEADRITHGPLFVPHEYPSSVD
jgi:hypothetical protein